MMRMRWGSLLIALCAVLTEPVCAQSWPTQPIKLIVGYTPGTGIDIIARSVGQNFAVGARHPRSEDLGGVVRRTEPGTQSAGFAVLSLGAVKSRIIPRANRTDGAAHSRNKGSEQ